jgi:hypothetical protein
MTSARAVCTIIAKNYTASARTLCQSFQSLHPNSKCYVLVVDDYGGFIHPDEEGFEIVRLSDLDIPNLPSFCFKYKTIELTTAVKPYLLKYLMENMGLDKLLYLDPDVLVTNALNSLYERLDEYDIVLTPHLDKDYPDDKLMPNDRWILWAGMFNLGFIGISNRDNARAFLDWWKSKLYDRCILDAEEGYAVDQRFIDFVPIIFSNVFVEREVGYNVAYWNLHSRRIHNDKGVWKCNDSLLYFFHFSNYRPENPDTISGYLTRYRLAQRPDLQLLFTDYRDRLLRNGYESSRSWPYSFQYFKTGEPIPDDLRVFYRNSPRLRGKYDNPFESRALRMQALAIRVVNIAWGPVRYFLKHPDELSWRLRDRFKRILARVKDIDHLASKTF